MTSCHLIGISFEGIFLFEKVTSKRTFEPNKYHINNEITQWVHCIHLNCFQINNMVHMFNSGLRACISRKQCVNYKIAESVYY